MGKSKIVLFGNGLKSISIINKHFAEQLLDKHGVLTVHQPHNYKCPSFYNNHKTWLDNTLHFRLSQSQTFCHPARLNPLPQNVDSTKRKDFAVDNFRFVENGRKFLKLGENTVGIGEIARYEQFLLFPQGFQNTCTADT